jgi:FAD:protein FMN transferase
MARKSSRREFLKGKAAAETLPDAVAPGAAQADASSTEAEPPIVHVTRRAMATEFELQFPDDPKRSYTELALEAFEELERVEEQLSFFRPTSEVSRVNLLADKQPVEVETCLFDLLTFGMGLFGETGGAWDMTSTPLWQAWGFAKRKGRIPTAAEIDEAMSRVGSQHVELDAVRKTVFFRKPGMRLNFGSVGKGYALDRCALRLVEGGMSNFLLHGGQSSILARGGMENGTGAFLGSMSAEQLEALKSKIHKPTPSGEKKGTGAFFSTTSSPRSQSACEKNAPVPFFSVPFFWPIGLPHPMLRNRRVGEIALRDEALGTSSSRFQSFRHGGKLLGHILDPRAGTPAEGVISATVLAPSAALADALSTAFYVLGLQRSLEYCERHPEISAILLMRSEGAEGCAVVAVNVPKGQFSRCDA